MNALATMAEKRIQYDMFDQTVQTVCTLHVLAHQIVPKLAELYEIYLNNLQIYEDTAVMVLDSMSAIS